jgi:DNA-binding NarL/FixJ family response regulator
MRILIVDDSAPMRATLREILSGVTDDINECSDGEDALEAYDRLHPDLVLMDIRMPGMDGITATMHILKAHADAHVAMVTEHNDPRYRMESDRLGAHAYFLKDDLRTLRMYVEKLAS